MSTTPIQKPQVPAPLTAEGLETYKKAMRRYDRARIAAGTDAAEIQAENSAFPPAEGETKLSRFAF